MTQLSQLSLSERLELVQDLWDSIDKSKQDLPAAEWRRELVHARLAEFDGQEETTGLTREQVWREVDQRRGT